MSSENPLTQEAFRYLAQESGLNPEDPHMAELYSYAKNVLEGLRALRDIDVSDVEPDMAFIPYPPYPEQS